MCQIEWGLVGLLQESTRKLCFPYSVCIRLSSSFNRIVSSCFCRWSWLCFFSDFFAFLLLCFCACLLFRFRSSASLFFRFLLFCLFDSELLAFAFAIFCFYFPFLLLPLLRFFLLFRFCFSAVFLPRCFFCFRLSSPAIPKTNPSLNLK